MKYYVIEEKGFYGTRSTRPICVVEKEEIAKDLIKRYNGLTYFEHDTKENQDEYL